MSKSQRVASRERCERRERIPVFSPLKQFLCVGEGGERSNGSPRSRPGKKSGSDAGTDSHNTHLCFKPTAVVRSVSARG